MYFVYRKDGDYVVAGPFYEKARAEKLAKGMTSESEEYEYKVGDINWAARYAKRMKYEQ